MSERMTWTDKRAEIMARPGALEAYEAARMRCEKGKDVSENLGSAQVIGPFPWQCPHCGHHRDDHPRPVPPARPAADGSVWSPAGSCSDCPSCAGPVGR